jgi:hypothetical protein
VTESVAASHRAARRRQRISHEITEDYRLAVAVSLLAVTVAALAWISGAASTGPTANVHQAD